MNLTVFQQQKLEENKKKIMDSIDEVEKIIGHGIKAISLTTIDSPTDSKCRSCRIHIAFELESL